MAIMPLNKVTIYGMSEQKPAILDGLQRLGCLHLISLKDAEAEEQKPKPVSKQAREALKYLQSCATIRRTSTAKGQYNRHRVIRETLEIKSDAERLQSEHDHLAIAIEQLTPWGEFDLAEVEREVQRQLWFYQVPLHELSTLPEDLVWYEARRDNQFAYVVVVSVEQPTGLPVAPLTLERRPLSELRARLEEVEEHLDELHWQRVSLTRWRRLLANDLAAADDASARDAADAGIIDDETVFAVRGYVPATTCTALRAFADRESVALTIESVEQEEPAPTLLKNPKEVAGAEGCVTFYMTPGYHAWDPTSVVFFSFSLFYAMIVSDAGYGMVMAIGLALFWRRLGQSESLLGMRNLLLGIVIATIVYGVLVGSYFGVEPRPGSLPDRLRVRINGEPMMSNQTAMMVISVAIGVAHLVLANLVSAWNRRTSSRWIGHLGWAMAMLGAFLIGGGSLAEVPTLGTFGKILVAIGAIAILLFSSDRPWEASPKGIALRLMDGVMQGANISKAFGDVLSYLRLFALGLASAQLAVTFNGLAADASHAGGIGLLLAIVILVAGHSINFVLGIMGGVVHGLRLNCIEFFNWSLTEEGYAFQPFRKKSKE